ncbi:glycosyltransferase [Halocola ammonii]
MKLSVIIVNYNVEHFLEQCLHSVEKSIKDLEVEVFVVDNNSVDGSMAMVKRKFPWAKRIENKENLGFSKANNQAMRMAEGEYVLLLNPDTVVQEDTFQKVVSFMDEHPDAGGLGVKMVDGKGNFLPESKRGLPTPAVAFYKIFGLSALFPKSKKFSQYHLGYLDKDEVHEIDVLSGAFMLMRKEALDKVGLLDEAFFMYGEDIDLSYRITQGGYKNYYFPDTRIIHYKGESTKKGSLNYVFVFYRAMVIFAEKHFSAKNAKLFSFFINMAIYLRAGVAIVNRFVKRVWLPVLDFLLIFGLMELAKNYYEEAQHKNYDEQMVSVAFVVYAVIWQLSVFFSGGYDRPFSWKKIIRGIAIGSAVILIGYSLLPEDYRFSRALILIGTGLALLEFLIVRSLLHFIGPKRYAFSRARKKRFVIVGSKSEIERVQNLLSQTQSQVGFTAFLSPEDISDEEFYNGTLSQLNEVLRIYNIDEVIFCAKDVSSREIIGAMSSLDSRKTDFKIAPPESLFIIGSNSIESSADLFILDVNSVSKTVNQRNKRLLDFTLALLFIITSPLLVWWVRKKAGFFANCFSVLLGKKTWVGFFSDEASGQKLPKIKNGVLPPVSRIHPSELNSETRQKLNLVYARDYRVGNDINVIFKNIASLGS